MTAEDGEELGLGSTHQSVVDALVDQRLDPAVRLAEGDDLFDFICRVVGLSSPRCQDRSAV